MIDNVVALYSIMDDLLKAIGHREDLREELTDAEVITTALTAALYFGGNLETSRDFMMETGFRRMTRNGRWMPPPASGGGLDPEPLSPARPGVEAGQCLHPVSGGFFSGAGV